MRKLLGDKGARRSLEAFQEFADFCLGRFVALHDCEVQGVFENGFGVGGAGEGEEGFGLEDLCHHPIFLFLDTEVEVLDGVLVAVFLDERLGERETEELIVRVFGYERLETLGFHAS